MQPTDGTFEVYLKALDHARNGQPFSPHDIERLCGVQFDAVNATGVRRTHIIDMAIPGTHGVTEVSAEVYAIFLPEISGTGPDDEMSDDTLLLMNRLVWPSGADLAEFDQHVELGYHLLTERTAYDLSREHPVARPIFRDELTYPSDEALLERATEAEANYQETLRRKRERFRLFRDRSLPGTAWLSARGTVDKAPDPDLLAHHQACVASARRRYRRILSLLADDPDEPSFQAIVRFYEALTFG